MASKRSQPYIIIPFILALSGSCAEKHLAEGNFTGPLLRPQAFDLLGLDPDEDYNNYKDPTPPPTDPTHSPEEVKPERCDYDHCRDQQRPCLELLAASGCQCPGLSGPQVVPEAPFLKELLQRGAEVVVRWCSPASTVSHYQIAVKGREPLVFTGISREGVLTGLEAGEEVCVEAVNAAGVSSPAPLSCQTYEPERDEDLALRAGLIAGGVGLLLLVSLVIFLLWRRRKA